MTDQETQTISAGFKQTEVGVIPGDWGVKSLDELFSFRGGFTASRNQLSEDGFCYLHYGDIHSSDKPYIDVQEEFSDIPKLKVSINLVPKKSLLRDGDVVFVDASEDDEGASKHIVILNPKGITYISGLHTIVSKSKDESLENKYKQYCFQTADVKRQFKFYAVGTKITGISKTNIARIFIPYPPKPEQTAIASVLSEIDALIASLEKLIAKKRAIKQGTMQELLIGKRRLLGFSGEWEVEQISDFGEIITGSTPPTKIKDYWDGDVPWVTPTDITDRKDIYNSEREITPAGLAVIRKLPQNSLLVTCIASIGKNAILKRAGACNQQINAIVPNNGHDVDFLYYLFEGRKQYLLGHAGITATNIISKKNFSEIYFSVPRRSEQTAIAQALSDMDAEIEALEQKLEKYRMIKQGMMQILLTGKIRLI